MDERTNELDVHDFYVKSPANEIMLNHLRPPYVFPRALRVFDVRISHVLRDGVFWQSFSRFDFHFFPYPSSF